MSFYWAAIAFHWIFITVTLVLCVIAAMPTRAWMSVTAWLKTQLTRRKNLQFETALAAVLRPFTPDESFFARGGGLAFDQGRGLIFLARPNGGTMKSAIYPVQMIGSHSPDFLVDNGFQEVVLKITLRDDAETIWRLPCVDDTLAHDMDAALARFCQQSGADRPAPQAPQAPAAAGYGMAAAKPL